MRVARGESQGAALPVRADKQRGGRIGGGSKATALKQIFTKEKASALLARKFAALSLPGR